MLRLKADSSKLSQNGSVPNDLFADVSTRVLNSVIVGENCGKISTGTGNSFVGYDCGAQNSEGSFGVFVGFQAGQFNKNANWNTFLGSYSGRNNTRGSKNTFVGFRAGELTLDGNESTAIGVNAMRENSVGNRNVAVGVSAGERVLEGDNNTMIGVEAGQNMRSGNLNTMAGFRSGRGAFKGNENTYFGAYSGYSNENGDGNAFIGYKSGEYLTQGSYNVAVGAYTMRYATEGSCNIALGAFSGSLLTGSGNVLVGTGANANTINGDFNTSIGTNTGFNANGGNNVYIGYETATNVNGEKNVVIGSSAFTSNHSVGSVAIGYNIADAMFKKGSNNIFIGIGADSHTSTTSFAIAIGSKSTRAGDKAIAIGEEIDNDGSNSVLIGYDLYSDSDQCVSIGYKTEINNVVVFNDPLNYIFPVNTITEYETFNLKENYMDTLYLGGVSNAIAVATIYASNLYDSGCNLLQGVIRTSNINLLDYIGSNIVYHNITVLAEEFNNKAPYISDNRNIPPYNFQILNTMTQSILRIPVHPDYVASNLIPTSDLTYIDYEYTIGRRIGIQKLIFENQYETACNQLKSDSIYVTDIQSLPLLLETNEVQNFFPTNLNRYVILEHPYYGDLKIENEKVFYEPYREGFFALNDSFRIAYATQLDTKMIVPEGIMPIKLSFTNRSYPSQSNINLYPFGTPTEYDIGTASIISKDINLEYIPLSKQFQIIDPTLPISEPIVLSDDRIIRCTYNAPIFQKAIGYSNIILSMKPYSFEKTVIPVPIERVVEQPLYGRLENNIYEPYAFNFTNDIFKIISEDVLYTITIRTDNGLLKTQNLNFLEKPLRITFDSNVYTQYLYDIEMVPLYIRYQNKRVVNDEIEEFISKELIQTDPYIPSVGYLHTCNIDITERTIELTFEDVLLLPNEPEKPPVNAYINTTGPPYYDYTIYERDTENNFRNPVIATITFNWDYNYPNGLNPDPFTGFREDDFTYIPQVFSNVNTLGFNRYTLLNKTIRTTKLYKMASNTDIFNSNIFYQNDIYRDDFNNYIYNNRYDLGLEPISKSNYTYFTPSFPFTETITRSGYSNDNYITSNISTIQLRDSIFYGYSMTYTTSPLNKLTVLQQNKGIVESFHQSNITNGEVHLWDSMKVQSNLELLEHGTIPITYYSNLEIATSNAVPIDFRKGIYHLSNEIIVRTENIDFLDRSNVCLGYDGRVFIQYIDKYSNVVEQTIPTTYSNVNTIDLNIGLVKERRPLRRTDLFTYSNNEDVIYEVKNDIIRFYKDNIRTTEFIQKDIDENRITIDGWGTGYVDLGRVSLNVSNYIQNYYLESNSIGSNIFEKGINRFIGPLWDDIAERQDNLHIQILKDPLNGILYSSNTHTLLSVIDYISFSNEKNYYIPYEPMSLESDVMKVFFSYSNVVSPIYSVSVQNGLVKDRTIENIVERIKIEKEKIKIDVDASNYTYLNRLLTITERQDIIFYVVLPPKNGIIMNENFMSVGFFTYEDIIGKKVFYQNYKGQSDRFDVRIGTGLYDLTLETLIIELNVLPLPRLLKNSYDYIYGNTDYTRLDSSKLDISSGGIYVFEKDYMEIYVREGTEYVERDYFLKDEEVYYKPAPKFFEFNSNENRTMKIRFFTYSNTEMNEPNRLSRLDVYKDIYNQEWFSKFNTFDSFNVIVEPIDPLQIISYTKQFDDNLFKDRKCKITFDYKPLQAFLSGEVYNDFLRTYKFFFELIDFEENTLIHITFEENTIRAIIGSQNIVINIDEPIFDWNVFSIVNNDDTNDDRMSLYLNDINYLVAESVESIDFSRLKTIKITVPIEDEKNMYSGTITTLLDEGQKMYYNFENYNTKLYFRSFEILLGITEALEDDAKYKTTYNIAIGDYLRVNGFNNICIGKNFLTTGVGSIIIGNDIGSTPNTSSMLAGSFNEIFNSIIVSTSSFIQTKVRDVIAIGNNIMNEAGGSEEIDLFFSKRPVLIGNDITPNTLDFHLNIQNTFLKTSVGFNQVYCGLEGEAVCIGYTSNEYFNNTSNVLYVNGNVLVDGTVIEKDFEKTFRRHVYPSLKLTTGEIHSYEKRIRWENAITDIRDTIRLKCAFRYVGLNEYGYYNFESVISLVELYSITTSKSVSTITHVIETDDDKKGMTIRINYITEQIIDDYVVVDMELEAEILNRCGECVFV
jgi:hypothetical protein